MPFPEDKAKSYNKEMKTIESFDELAALYKASWDDNCLITMGDGCRMDIPRRQGDAYSNSFCCVVMGRDGKPVINSITMLVADAHKVFTVKKR